MESPSTIHFFTSSRGIVHHAMSDRGWEATDSDGDWDVWWTDLHHFHEAVQLPLNHPTRKINHFKNHYELTRKDHLIKNVKRARAAAHSLGLGGDEYNFTQRTFLLPQEHALFYEEFKRVGGVWIMKPVGKAQGRGIFLINKMSQISQWKLKQPWLFFRRAFEAQQGPSALTPAATSLPDLAADHGTGVVMPGSNNTPEAYIIQKYIEDPYLIAGEALALSPKSLI